MRLFSFFTKSEKSRSTSCSAAVGSPPKSQVQETLMAASTDDVNVQPVKPTTGESKTDSDEMRNLAMRMRDGGLGDKGPSNPNYDKCLQELWGGPMHKWYDIATAEWKISYAPPTKRTALVTGSSGGIGFFIARSLAIIGYDVILPARDAPCYADTIATVASIKKAAPESKLIVPKVTLDLRSFQSVEKFARCVKEDCSVDAIDVLCLNAGRGGGIDDTRETTVDGHEVIMQLNTMSHFKLTHDLMPLLRKSPDARVIVTSSTSRNLVADFQDAHDLDGTRQYFSAFNQYLLSKAAMVLFIKSLNERLLAYGVRNVRGIIADPGICGTGVNIQHDLTKSLGNSHLGMTENLEMNTNQLHDALGIHAADGALPIILACVDKAARHNDWYTTDGPHATKVSEAAHIQNPRDPDPKREENLQTKPSVDPLNEEVWPRELRESVWAQCQRATGANWIEALM